MHSHPKNTQKDHRSQDETGRGCAQGNSYRLFQLGGEASHRQWTPTSSGLRVQYQMVSPGTKFSHQSASSTQFNEFQSSQVPRYACKFITAL